MSKIIIHPNNVLKKKAAPVPLEKIGSPEIKRIIQEMSATLRKSPEGIGIAAPQIGHSLRIFLASEEALKIDEAREMPEEDRRDHKWEHYIFINPVITKYSKRGLKDIEGCLSLPGKFGLVDRSQKVTMEAYDEHGKKFTRGASKLFARLMQHEMDHLDGHLFIEKAKNVMEVKKEKQHKN